MDSGANFPPDGTSNTRLGGNVLSEIVFNPKSCACTEPSGDVIGRRRLPNFELRESVYARGLTLPRHSHSHAYLSYVIQGQYTETYHGSSAACESGTLRFLPAGEAHSNAYDDGARCLLIRLDPATVDNLREHSKILETPGQVRSPKAEWLARRLYGEFRERDSAAAIAIEGLILELLAEGARCGDGVPRDAPKWLRRAKEMIDAKFLDVPSLTSIAKEAGIHPVHLSREFRRYFSCTVGDYMRKLRVDHASRMLTGGRTPLVEIASVCGFADQSHFSSTFKRTVGITPARFREMHS